MTAHDQRPRILLRTSHGVWNGNGQYSRHINWADGVCEWRNRMITKRIASFGGIAKALRVQGCMRDDGFASLALD